jgi:hypothetical protein
LPPVRAIVMKCGMRIGAGVGTRAGAPGSVRIP